MFYDALKEQITHEISKPRNISFIANMVATCIHPFKAVDPASPLSPLPPDINQLQLKLSAPLFQLTVFWSKKVHKYPWYW